jgi:hypothetical protein
MFLVCALIFVLMFSMPLAILFVIIDGLKKIDPDIEID